MPLDALILDVDGTLVDTNSTHVACFVKSFADFGYAVAPDRIAIEIGKGGDQLVGDVLGQSAEEKDGDAIREAFKVHFLDIAKTKKFAVLPGAEEIIKIAKKDGLKVAIATSGETEFLEAIEKSCGVSFSKLVNLVVTGSDAKKSKPAPDIVSATTQKLGLSPAQCGMVGDTIHDARACRAAGVVCAAVATGGNAPADLREAGARLVFRDCAEIAGKFKEFLGAVAPGSVQLDQPKLEELMREALKVAREGIEVGELPIGSVIADGAGNVVARAFRSSNRTGNKTGHSEILALAKAAGKIALDSRDFILVTTVEPCVMCIGAAMEACTDVVVFGLGSPFDGGTHRISAPRGPHSQMPRIVGKILEKEVRALLKEWLQDHGEGEPGEYVKGLLSS